ncbi:MAG: MarR family winged helix-turn-helix transcriptional regulator [Sneathiella sp.]
MTKKPGPDLSLDFQIINWIGIIEQLTAEKSKQLLEGTDVPPPQFKLLNHFSHRPDEGKTVTQIATAMQQPQPGVTKTAAKMVLKQYLREHANPDDGRSKILFLTDTGKAAHLMARTRLITGMSQTFDGWEEADKKQFFEHLDRLKIFLDANR